MKIVVSASVFAVCWCTRGVGRLLGVRSNDRVTILYYHGVPYAKRAAFARQLERLARLAHVVPADWRGPTDPTRPTVAITFDDAFVSVIDNALPELQKYGFPCTI